MKMDLITGRRVFQHSLVIGTTLFTCAALQANDDQYKSQGGPATSERGEKGAHANKSEEFVQKVLQCGQMEIQMGQLAQQKAQNQQVKDLGAALVRDHTQSNQKLQQIAQQSNVQTSKGHDAHADKADKHQKTLDSLKNQSGAEFDKAFVTHAIKDHKKSIGHFEKCQKDVQEPQLKAFIDETLPKLRQHLQMAQTAARAVGVDEAKITMDIESETDAAAGAPATGVSGANDQSDRKDSTIQNNNRLESPRGSLESSREYRLNGAADSTASGTINQNNAAISADAQVGDNSIDADVDANVDVDRKDLDVQADLNADDDDRKVFQKGDGKVLGLSTSKGDGKILGIIPAPGRNRDSSSDSSAEVDTRVDTDNDTASGAPGVAETGRSGSVELRFTEAPAAVKQALRDQGLSEDTARLKKMTVYEAEVNGKKIHVTEDGKVYQHGKNDSSR
jgi:putative membrane protein